MDCFVWNAKNVTYFDSFEAEHVLKEIRKIIGNKNITTNIYTVQAYDSIMCEYFCIGFIDFMLKDKILLEHTNLFSPNDYKKNDEVVLTYFHYSKRWKIILCLKKIWI